MDFVGLIFAHGLFFSGISVFFLGSFQCKFWLLANSGGLVTAQVEVVSVSIGGGGELPPSLPASSFFLPFH